MKAMRCCGVGLPLLFDRVSSQHTLGLSLGCLDCSVGGQCSCTAAWKTQVNRHKCCATATIDWCWIGNRNRWLWMGVGGLLARVEVVNRGLGQRHASLPGGASKNRSTQSLKELYDMWCDMVEDEGVHAGSNENQQSVSQTFE